MKSVTLQVLDQRARGPFAVPSAPLCFWLLPQRPDILHGGVVSQVGVSRLLAVADVQSAQVPGRVPRLLQSSLPLKQQWIELQWPLACLCSMNVHP